MAKKFLKWLVKDIIAPISVDAMKKFTDAVLDKSWFRYNGERVQYAYNCSI